MTQVERIKYYECLLDRVTAAGERLDAALEEFNAVQPLVAELSGYYGSRKWRRDYEDDEAGKLPADLKRGILSEDALYDALTENDRLVSIVGK
ncbi:MAG: DUF4298 domain-containing protein [Oscillospiraceae bacterium]|nr:DUF4298 domain-containing protein [Oscillospiraceae bacterium]